MFFLLFLTFSVFVAFTGPIFCNVKVIQGLVNIYHAHGVALCIKSHETEWKVQRF